MNKAAWTEYYQWRDKVRSRGKDVPFSFHEMPRRVVETIKGRLDNGEPWRMAFKSDGDFSPDF